MIKGTIRAGEDMKPGTKARGRGRHQDLPDRAARGRGTRRRSWPIRGRPGGHRDGDWCPFHGARLVGESAGLRRAGRGGGPGPKPRRQRGPGPLAHRSFAQSRLAQQLPCVVSVCAPRDQAIPRSPRVYGQNQKEEAGGDIGKTGARGGLVPCSAERQQRVSGCGFEPRSASTPEPAPC